MSDKQGNRDIPDPTNLSLGSRIKFLAKDTAIYGLASGFNKVLALVTFPMLARHFSVADYGTIDLLNSVVLIGTIILVFGQDSAVARFFYASKDDFYRRQVVSQSLSLQILAAALIVPVGLLLADQLVAMGGGISGGADLMRLLLLQVPFFMLLNFSQNILKWTFRRSQFLLVSVGSTVLTTTALIIGIVFFELSLIDVFVIHLITRAAFGGIGLYLVRDWLTLPKGWGRLKEMLPFAVPFGILGVLISLLPFLERWFVQTTLGSHELGLYAAGAKIAMLIMLPISAFEMSWGSFSLSIYREKDAAATYKVTLKIVTVSLMMLLLFLTAFGEPLVVILASSRYEGAGVVVFCLGMGFAAHALASILGVGAIIAKRSSQKLPGYGVMIVAASVTIPILSKEFGLAGTALGSLFAHLARTAIDAWLSQRVYPIDFDFKSTSLFLLLILAIGILHMMTFGMFTLASISLVPLTAGVLILPLAWYMILDKNDRRELVSVARASLKK